MLLHGAPGFGASRIVLNEVRLSEADQTIYTFAAVDLGDVEPSRLVAVAAYCGSSNIVDDGNPFSLAVSVGGYPLTIFRANNNDINEYELALWVGVVPEGATGDVVVEWKAGCTRCEVAVFSLYNQRWPVDENGDFDFSDYYAYDISYYIDDTSGEIGTFDAGVDFFVIPYVRTFTGFESTFAGTYISGGYQVSTGYIYRPFTVSSAIEERNFIGGGIGFGP